MKKRHHLLNASAGARLPRLTPRGGRRWSQVALRMWAATAFSAQRLLQICDGPNQIGTAMQPWREVEQCCRRPLYALHHCLGSPDQGVALYLRK
jgi:hypothetical protein